MMSIISSIHAKLIIKTEIVCYRCSRFEIEIRRLRIHKPVRVCQACFNSLKAQQSSDVLCRDGKPVMAKPGVKVV